MTVWIVNPFDNLPCEGNRPQRYWLMAQAFADAGWDVVYWTSDFNHGKKAKRDTGRGGAARTGREKGLGSRGLGIRVEMIPTRPYRKNVCLARIWSHLKLARDFKRMARVMLTDPTPSSPSLVIASTPPLGLCAAAMEVARECGAKFVCDIQDAWPETFGRLLPRGFKWMGAVLFAGMRRTAKKIYREADFVTGVSRRYAELSGRKDFYLAYHGIDNASGRPGVPTLPSSLVPRPSSLVYIGNLGAGYDLGTVIEAVAKRAGLTLDIAGLGPGEESLRFRVQSLGLESRVRFHGYLGAEALEKLMASCDVGVIPMRDDSWVGLPYKLGDYLKAGLRVVSSLHGECGEFLTHMGFGQVYDEHSPDSLLAALDALKPVAVALPDELRADLIYPQYVRTVVRTNIRLTLGGESAGEK